MSCAAIVLAAGNSTRMGKQKIVLPFNGVTVIQHIVTHLQESGIEDIMVVVGRDASQIRNVLRDTTATIIDNPEYEQGMLTSVRVGIRSLSNDAESCLICLGDQPAIQPEIVKAIIKKGEVIESRIIVPRYRNRRGHPLYIPRSYWSKILTSYDETGLRGLLIEFKESVIEICVEESWILDDMDYPEDYQRELKRLNTEK
jgi:molybdenum cofactor cytidylyltransferase